jgi:hypothetical protein
MLTQPRLEIDLAVREGALLISITVASPTT